jgi:hypothetical protein
MDAPLSTRASYTTGGHRSIYDYAIHNITLLILAKWLMHIPHLTGPQGPL